MAEAGSGRARVEELLDELGIDYADGGHGSLRVAAGSTAVYIDTQPIEDIEVVRLIAPVLVDVDASPERLVQLLELNAELTFGKFSWDPAERMISVDYELVADAVDAVEIHAALDAVRRIADTCDDRLQPRLGGRLPHAI